MADAVLSYDEICRREGVRLRQGMAFGLGGSYSVVLTSSRPDAPYRDRVEDSGTTLIYEGHDIPRGPSWPDPKLTDQPLEFASGAPTQNGRFHAAAQLARLGRRPPERVRVYEKIRPGIWSDDGLFDLVDSWSGRDEHRAVWMFKLVAVDDEGRPGRRLIPTGLKPEVWARDRGKCSTCGSADGLRFVPVGGGTPLRAADVRLVCERHEPAEGGRIGPGGP